MISQLQHEAASTHGAVIIARLTFANRSARSRPLSTQPPAEFAAIADSFNVYGYSAAQLLVKVLAQCGDDLTHANVMRQAANLRDVRLPMLPAGNSHQHQCR